MRALLKKIYYIIKNTRLLFKRRFRKIISKVLPNIKYKRSYVIAILCIKKTEYADMAITNINSLHAINPTHKFVLYCDTICEEYLKSKIKLLDYPDSTDIINKFGIAGKAWQYYKIEVHIEASKKGQIDTDADGIWYKDPNINMDKITMLAFAHNFIDKPNEKLILNKIFPSKKEYLSYKHCVAAFVSIPPKFMTDKLESDMRTVNDMIFTSNLEFLEDDKDRGDSKRLSEEFAVNIAIQSNWPERELVFLKENEGWGNKDTLQLLYYGCDHQINE